MGHAVPTRSSDERTPPSKPVLVFRRSGPIAPRERREAILVRAPGLLEALGITDVFFELFDAKHGAIEYEFRR